MAAPHVAGVVALMKALEPDLTPRDIEAVLTATARPLSGITCRRGDGNACGAGLIDAKAALSLVQSGQIPTPPLSFTPEVLAFGSEESELELTLMNNSDSNLTWQYLRYEANRDNLGTAADGVLSIPNDQPTSGTLQEGEQTTTRLVLDRTQVDADGSYEFRLIFEANGEEMSLPVRFSRRGDTETLLKGPIIVAAFIEDSSGEWVLSGAQESAGIMRDYTFSVLAGENTVIAWSDENDNIEIDTGDYLGSYPDWVAVDTNAALTGLDITLSEVVETKGMGFESGMLRALENVQRKARGKRLRE